MGNDNRCIRAKRHLPAHLPSATSGGRTSALAGVGSFIGSPYLVILMPLQTQESCPAPYRRERGSGGSSCSFWPSYTMPVVPEIDKDVMIWGIQQKAVEEARARTRRKRSATVARARSTEDLILLSI